MISEANLDFWINNQYNVLLRGRHGVGKTAMILEAFNKHGLKWKYFSASTMDPWVDFIGVPKEKVDEKGVPYLDLIRPKHFQEDDVEAIFLDEFNRSPKKVRNAVMELIQFKSINGKKFNNLKIVWAAINPEDDDQDKYDVEPLDPAQLDRFHICVDIPYFPHVPYFREKYGQQTGDVAVTWWKQLTKEQQNKISPRRLDYAIDIYKKGGDLKFVLPKEANISKLLTELSYGSISSKLKELFNNKDEKLTMEFLRNENNYNASEYELAHNQSQYSYFLKLVPKEKLIGLITKYPNVEKYIFNNVEVFKPVIQSVADADASAVGKRAKNLIQRGLFVNPQLSTNTQTRVSSYQKWNNQLKYSVIKNVQEAQTMFSELITVANHSHYGNIQKKMPQLFSLINMAKKYLDDNNVKPEVADYLINRYKNKFAYAGVILPEKLNNLWGNMLTNHPLINPKF